MPKHSLLPILHILTVGLFVVDASLFDLDKDSFPGKRHYDGYEFDTETGFIRAVSVTRVRNITKRSLGYSNDFTIFEAIPYSLDQMLRSYGHALLDSTWDVHEISPVVHVHMIWTEENTRPISLPCWAPAQPLTIEFNETTLRGHKRTWLIGQGNTLSLSRETPVGELPRPRMTFSQTHMIYYQTTEETLQRVRGKVEVEMDLSFFAPEGFGPTVSPIKLNYSSYNASDCKAFFGDYIITEKDGTKYAPSIWEPEPTNDTRNTHKLPANNSMKFTIKLRFTNGMINCHMIRQLFEPDLGELQQTLHHMSLDGEPYNPLAHMLTPFEMAWVRERDIPDAVKYRPTLCTEESLQDYRIGTDQTVAYNRSAGYTVIFKHDNKTDIHYAIASSLGEGECSGTLKCTNGSCQIVLVREGQKNLSWSSFPKQGLYGSRKQVGNISNFIILIAYPFETQYSENGTEVENQWIQRLLVMENGLLVFEGALLVGPPGLAYICRDTVTTTMGSPAMLKILNYPAFELIGASERRANASWCELMKKCSESFSGVEFTASGVTQPLDAYPNNEHRFHFTIEGKVCTTACTTDLKQYMAGNASLYCTDEDGNLKKCLRHYYVEARADIHAAALPSESWQMVAAAVQLCEASLESIAEDSPYAIYHQQQVCYFTGQIQSASHYLTCKIDGPLSSLTTADTFSNLCKFKSRDDDYEHRFRVTESIMKPVLIVRKCEPKSPPRRIFTTYRRDPDYSVYRLTYNERICPIGHRRTKTFEGYTCIICPADSYADLDTELTSCQGCPLSRPSTYSGSATSSDQCSNDELNKLRGLFFRYDMNSLSDEEWDKNFNLASQMWWNKNYTVIESLDHLKPEEHYLEQQRQAIALFMAMTQLTFSNTEVFLMLIISTALAVFGGLNFLLLLIATSRPADCPSTKYYGETPNWRERLGLSIYCMLHRLATMIYSLARRSKRRIGKGYLHFRKSAQSSRFSTATSNISRKVSNLLQKRFRDGRMPPLSEGQKALVHLLTKTTIDRIVESAEREINDTRDRGREFSEEQLRRRHEAGEVEADANEAELAAEVAKRELVRAVNQVADSKDGRSKTAATQRMELAKAHATQLSQRAEGLRALARRRVDALNEYPLEEKQREYVHKSSRWLTPMEKRAIAYAPRELQAYLKKPRHHTPEYFLLHSDMFEQEDLRKTNHPAPDRDIRRE